jgi:hypothetical protein
MVALEKSDKRKAPKVPVLNRNECWLSEEKSGCGPPVRNSELVAPDASPCLVEKSGNAVRIAINDIRPVGLQIAGRGLGEYDLVGSRPDMKAPSCGIQF